MFSYILRRLLVDVIPAIAVVAVVAFTLIHLTPGDPASVALGEEARPEQVAALRAQLGLNDSLPVQFGHWASRIAHLDLGQSIFRHDSVFEGITSSLPWTLELTLLALTFGVVFGVSAGIAAALSKGGLLDKIVMGIAMLGISMPSFYLALLMSFAIGVKLGWLPTGGSIPFAEDPLGNLRSMIMPALVLSLIEGAFISRVTRSSMLDIKGLDFVRTARAKGAAENRVVLVHMLRNAMVPIVSSVAVVASLLMGGAIIVETIFGIPGMGQLVIHAVQNRDYPVLQGVVLTVAGIYIMINLAADVLCAMVDHRIRFN
jgi:peptide/nickel transport system permease protein